MSFLAWPARQRGSASLLVALVLMTSMTLITLSAARTQLTETRMAGNEQRLYRLQLAAASAWETATQRLTTERDTLTWRPAGSAGGLVSEFSPAGGDADIQTHVRYERTDKDNPFIAIQALSQGTGDTTGQADRFSQLVRLLTVLAPAAESLPPLALNGCLSPAAAVDIRPLDSDNDAAADALWQFNSGPCLAAALVDLHNGRIVDKPPAEDLWASIFSISRDDYARLATTDLAVTAAQRRYWLADAAVWRRSLGSATQPVVLVFPRTVGCPRFGAGVRIFGVVYIDTVCHSPLADAEVEITGSLVVNGDIDAGGGRLRLNHIQVADPAQVRLALPVLRVVKVPGSWRDF